MTSKSNEIQYYRTEEDGAEEFYKVDETTKKVYSLDPFLDKGIFFSCFSEQPVEDGCKYEELQKGLEENKASVIEDKKELGKKYLHLSTLIPGSDAWILKKDVPVDFKEIKDRMKRKARKQETPAVAKKQKLEESEEEKKT